MPDNLSVNDAVQGLTPSQSWNLPAQRIRPLVNADPNHPASVALRGIISGLLGAPKRAWESAAAYRPGEEHDPGPITDMAMMSMGGGMPAAEPGAAGIFGGRLAKTANLDQLNRAIELADRPHGVKLDRMWDETGWTTGKDQRLRFEIPDLHSMVAAGKGSLQGHLFHPELYKAYPKLKDYKADFAFNPFEGGSFMPDTKTLSVRAPDAQRMRKIALHEAQHAVQDIEGFDGGASELAIRNWLGSKEKPSEGALSTLYNRNAGEVEARNVETRADYDSPLRQRIAPYGTEDVPYHKQILGNPRDMAAALDRYRKEQLLRQLEMENYRNHSQAPSGWDIAGP